MNNATSIGIGSYLAFMCPISGMEEEVCLRKVARETQTAWILWGGQRVSKKTLRIVQNELGNNGRQLYPVSKVEYPAASVKESLNSLLAGTGISV